jgi:beta-ureidopropionase
MSRVIRVAGVQHNRVIGDIAGNLERIEKWVRKAAVEGAQIVALPELGNTGYICGEVNDSYFDLAEEIPGPTTRFFEDLARELGIVLLGSLYERDAVSHVYYNSAVFVGTQGLIGRYRKTHIASKPTFMEKYYFAPGNLGYPVFDLGFCRAGVTICYDRHFPECYRHMALHGAEIVFSITNTGSPHSIRMWDSIMCCNAYCNGMFVVQVNACGQEGVNCLHGQSAVVSPFGEFVVHLGEEEALLMADCDLDEMITARRNFGSIRDVIPGDFGLAAVPCADPRNFND